MDISRRKEKEKERKARKARMLKAKEENQKMEKENQPCSTSELINSCFAESTATSSWLFSSIKLRAWFPCIWWGWPCTCACFDRHLWRARVQETYTSRRTKPTWYSGTAKQRRQEVSCFGWRSWRSWSASVSSAMTTSASAQRSWFAR